MSKTISVLLQILSSISAAIIAIIIPVQLIFEVTSPFFFAINFIATVILIVDFVNNFISFKRRGNDSTELNVLDHSHDVLFLSIDFIGAIPFFLIGASSSLAIIRIVKLIRIAQYQSVWNKLAIRYGDYQKLGFFAYWVLLATHWIACGWLALHNTGSTDNFTSYTNSLYWTIVTLTSVGYGDITPTSNVQKIYSMGVMIFGVGIFGYVVGNVANILSSKDPARMAFQKNMESLKAFVQYRELPQDLQSRIRDYFAYLWKKRLGYDESDFLESLPDSLKNEVELHLRRKIINNIPLFKHTSEKFLNAIALKLKPAIYLPGDYIIREGEEGQEMYLIVKGKISIFKKQSPGTPIYLEDGSFVGEISLLKNEPRMANVVAESFVDVYVLSKEVFDDVVSQHPGISGKIKDVAEKRLKANKR